MAPSPWPKIAVLRRSSSATRRIAPIASRAVVDPGERGWRPAQSPRTRHSRVGHSAGWPRPAQRAPSAMRSSGPGSGGREHRLTRPGGPAAVRQLPSAATRQPASHEERPRQPTIDLASGRSARTRARSRPHNANLLERGIPPDGTLGAGMNPHPRRFSSLPAAALVPSFPDPHRSSGLRGGCRGSWRHASEDLGRLPPRAGGSPLVIRGELAAWARPGETRVGDGRRRGSFRARHRLVQESGGRPSSITHALARHARGVGRRAADGIEWDRFGSLELATDEDEEGAHPRTAGSRPARASRSASSPASSSTTSRGSRAGHRALREVDAAGRQPESVPPLLRVCSTASRRGRIGRDRRARRSASRDWRTLTGLATSQGEVATGAVLLAANAWTPALVRTWPRT
jgi:hypothetical protein